MSIQKWTALISCRLSGRKLHRITSIAGNIFFDGLVVVLALRPITAVIKAKSADQDRYQNLPHTRRKKTVRMIDALIAEMI